MTAPELSIVIPTFNERDNVAPLVERLRALLGDTSWEAIFVDDDSPDETWAAVKAVGAQDARIRCIRRVGRRGLSGACLEGMLASGAAYVAVMDADLQHDETLLTAMRDRLRTGDTDLVVASRYIEGGSAGGFSAVRARGSTTATRIAQKFLKLDLSDPMTGFFMIRREIVEGIASRLSTQGFKILLDIVVTAENLRIAELPYTFRERQHGESKLDAGVALEFAGLVLAKISNDVVSLRFIFFCIVGIIGLGVHAIALAFAHYAFAATFNTAQIFATAIAIASNFFINNALTYADRRLSGARLVIGLLRFYVVASIGAIANIGTANWLFGEDETWWVAGMAGALMGVIWNYVIASLFVWRTR
jgi:dolichol-phosphate mannosyltransferase